MLELALLLLTCRGRAIGRMRTVALIYARDGGDLVVVALHPGGQQWWRNFRACGDVEVILAGRRFRGDAIVVGSDAAARTAIRGRASVGRARPAAGARPGSSSASC